MTINSRYAIAVHAVLLLENPSGEWVSSDWIAGSVNTNPVVIRRILGILTASGLVEAARGAKGGYRLLRPAGRITLWEVYLAMREEGPFGLPATAPNPQCPIGKHIQGQLSHIYTEAENAMRSVLQAITVAELRARITGA